MSTERKLQFRPSPLQRADEAADAPKCKTSICQQISNLGLRGTMASTNLEHMPVMYSRAQRGG